MSARFNNAAAEAYEILPVGELSSLQEDETCYYATAVTHKSNDQLKLATVAWLKEPLQSWLAKVQGELPNTLATPTNNYSLPKIADGGCLDDTWAITSGPPDGREGHTAVWTGSEMIVWGACGQVDYLNTGGRYNPNTDSWTATATTNAPSARYHHTAIWTSSQMIVWGGSGGGNGLNTGGRYDAGTNTWTATN